MSTYLSGVSENILDNLRQRFNSLDVDGSGFVSIKELNKYY